MNIRDSGAQDAAILSNIMLASFSDAYGECWSATDMPAALSLSVCRARLAYNPAGEPAGFSLFRHVAGEAELLLIAVLPAHQKQGLGRLLLDDMIDQCRTYTVTDVYLEVRDGNARAQSLYSSFGFTTVGRREKYYRGKNGIFYDALTLKYIVCAT